MKCLRRSMVDKIMGAQSNDLESKKRAKEQSINSWHPEKINLAHEWIDQEKAIKGKGVVRGAVHYCSLGQNIGNEQNEDRPVIIVSSDRINSTSGNVLVAPLSKTLKPKLDRETRQPVLTANGKPIPKFSSHTFLFKDKYDFLTYDSAVMTEEIKSVSKARLKDHLGTVNDPADLRRLDTRIKWSLGL